MDANNRSSLLHRPLSAGLSYTTQVFGELQQVSNYCPCLCWNKLYYLNTSEVTNLMSTLVWSLASIKGLSADGMTLNRMKLFNLPGSFLLFKGLCSLSHHVPPSFYLFVSFSTFSTFFSTSCSFSDSISKIILLSFLLSWLHVSPVAFALHLLLLNTRSCFTSSSKSSSLHSFYSPVSSNCLLGPAPRSTLGRGLMMQKCSSALQELHDAL